MIDKLINYSLITALLVATSAATQFAFYVYHRALLGQCKRIIATLFKGISAKTCHTKQLE